MTEKTHSLQMLLNKPGLNLRPKLNDKRVTIQPHYVVSLTPAVVTARNAVSHDDPIEVLTWRHADDRRPPGGVRDVPAARL